jgi:antitoxin component YwqK of YwqJK toxin-antitoxin module
LISGITDPYFIHDTLEKITEMEKSQKSGEYVEYWKNGQMKIRAAFKNGRADGHIHGWYENGCDAFKGHFCEGVKQGIHMAFFPPARGNGPTVNYGRFLIYDETGKPHGEQITSYLSGHLETITRYKNGLLEGETGIYADKGKGLIEKRIYEKGILIDQQTLLPKYLKKQSKQRA